jgi:medium-chain acyl-[acyl-carrier-protein] hydrolase
VSEHQHGLSLSVTSAVNPWMIRSSAQAAPKVRLICVPHAGGTAALFRGWRPRLPAEVEVCAIQLPGRMSHAQAVPFTRVGPLTNALVQVLSGEVQQCPYALFGHCTGAYLVYEVARRLTASGRAPLHVFIACARPPHLPTLPWSYSKLSDRDLVAKLQTMGGTPPAVLSTPALLRILLPVLRADFEAAETYSYSPGAPIPCNATVFGGERDDLTEGDLAAWGALFEGHSSVEVLPGGHFLLDVSEALVVNAITRKLCGPVV